MTTEIKSTETARIRALNDALRKDFSQGHAVMTMGIAALNLHLDLRMLSFRFVFNPPGPPKPAAVLDSYAANGSGTVQGIPDREKEIQIAFWRRAAEEGFPDERARASAQKPKSARTRAVNDKLRKDFSQVTWS
jgi:hypothetical protein